MAEDVSAGRSSERSTVLLFVDRDDLGERLVNAFSRIESHDYTVIRATSPLEARATRTPERPDIALIDLSHPNAWRRQLHQTIRLVTEELPVVVLVGPHDRALATEAMRAGAQDFLQTDRLSSEVLERAVRYGTERYRLLRAQQRTESRFYRLIAECPDAAIVTTMQGELLFSNPPAAELLAPLKRGDPVAKIGLQVPGGADGIIKLEPDRPVEVRCLRVEWENRPAWLVMLKDVSLRMQVSDLRVRLAQSEKLAVIGQLAAGVAHEINNPLAFILANLSATLGQLQHLQDVFMNVRTAALESGAQAVLSSLRELQPNVFAELQEMLEDNFDGAERINTIVRELKVFSRQENEEREMVRVNDVVKSACHMVASQIRHRASLVKDLQDVQPVFGNRVKLMQILTNLLMNAAQALPNHRGQHERIEIKTSQDDHNVVISVSDTGTGISEEVRNRIFEPFFTTKPREVGTGIGLSLSAELARQHDGELVLVETSSQGSTFALRLPAADLERLPHSFPSARSACRASLVPVPAVYQPTYNGPNRRILLVDDEPNVRRSLMRMLRGYQVITAATGREAIEALQTHAFDAVICDLVMPDLDGVDVYEALEASRPDLLDRVIYTSGGAYTPRAAAFVANREIRFVEKPIHPQRFVELLEDVLGSPRSP